MIPKYMKEAEGHSADLMNGRVREIMESAKDTAEPEDSDYDGDSDDESEEEDKDDDETISDDGFSEDDSNSPDVRAANYLGNTLTDKVMLIWFARRPKLVHDYSRVGFLLSPNPTIMEEAKIQGTGLEFHDSVTNLIVKLMLDPSLIGQEREREKARLIDTFWNEHSNFTNRTGLFNRGHIWIIAENPNESAHMWHKKYSVPLTTVLGPLACIVTSKILGIGTAERNWKQFKEAKSGKMVNLGNEKAKKKAVIYGEYQQKKARLRKEKLSAAGKMWTDEDFECCKMDAFCKDIKDSVEAQKEGSSVRNFLAWKETWEGKKIDTKGNPIFEARLVRKYGGIQWLDPDNDYARRTAHPEMMGFFKKRGDNHYCVMACNDDFDFKKPPHEQENMYELWETNDDFFECVTEFYEKSPQLNVKCYAKGGEAYSDDE